jgi:iron-sulfur cluster repair protein YtfE (RIC family)
MSRPWGCRQGGGPACHAPGSGVAPDETVEAAARRSPRALEVLRGLAVDTCCSAALTLAQAAAAAGVPAERLRRALDEATDRP